MSKVVHSTKKVSYTLGYIKSKRWILSLCALFLVSFAFNFPLGKIIDQKIYSTLKSIPGCSISLKDYEVKFFLPRLELTNLSIPSRCIRQRGDNFLLGKAELYFRGLSFSPLGLSFKLKTKFEGSNIEAIFIQGTSKSSLLIEDNLIQLSVLKRFLPQVKLNGSVKIDLYTTLGKTGVDELKLNAMSKDLVIPAQKISGLQLSPLMVNNLLVQVVSTGKNKFDVQKFIIGDTNAPIRSKFTGKVKLNSRSPRNSNLDLKGEIAFSEQFLSDYSLIKLFLSRFDQKDGFYQVMINGAASNPTMKSPKQ